MPKTEAQEPVAIGDLLSKEGYASQPAGKRRDLGKGIYDSFLQKNKQLCCTYISGEEAIKVEGNKVVISLLNDFSLEHFPKYHHNKLEECCREIIGHDFKISYNVNSSLVPILKTSVISQGSSKQTSKKIMSFPYKSKGLDDLVVFKGNASAFDEAKTILDLLKSDKEPQSVVYLEGSNGSGKTTLISAIGFDSFNSSRLMTYLKIRDILDYFRATGGRSPALSDFLKDTRILAVDSFEDIFNPKGEALKGVQSLIHEILDYALVKNIQVVLASTEESRTLVGKLDENPALKDRVSGVKRINLELPFEDRVDFLKKFIPSLINNYPKTEEGLEKLAEFYHNRHPKPVSIREIAGTFLTASSCVGRNKELTPEVVNAVLSRQYNLFEAEKTPNPIEVMAAAVNLVSDLDIKEVIGESRKQPLVKARSYIALALQRLCGLSYPEIGSKINKTHSTAIKAVLDATKQLGSEEKINAFLDTIRKNLNK